MKNLVNRALAAKKKSFILFFAVLMSTCMMAQVSPTKFLGIPIDGTKQAMIQKLQAKGFTYDSSLDCLQGEFNGKKVNVYVVTYRGIVYRIMVAYQNTVLESDIKIEYNNLFRQFKNNPKYLMRDLTDEPISDDEDISYEMTVHSKRYSATFLQNTHDIDHDQVGDNAVKIAAEYIKEHPENDYTNEEVAEYLKTYSLYTALRNEYINNQVWFLIGEFEGKYYISIYYDNLYNYTAGEDL